MKKVLILLFVIGALGVGWLGLPKDTQTFEIVLTENGFEPSRLTVPRGSLVVFSTEVGKPFWPASDPHPLHEDYPVFDAKKPVKAGETWTFKAQQVGEWGFHDHLFFTHKGKVSILSKQDWVKKNKVFTREEISKMIDEKGPQESYANLKKMSDTTTTQTHSNIHIFGEVLYEKLGTEGISDCDDFAGFGCYHGFFIKAVSDRGIEVSRELNRVCVEKFGPMGLGCPHGIGHGLVEFLGYDKLGEALTICSGLTWQGTLFGCQGGVFMENNFRTIFREGGDSEIAVREAHGNLYEPCRSVDKKFRQACYFEQAAWWQQVLNSDDEKVGGFCQGITDSGEKEACFMGLGNAVGEESGYDKEAVIRSCSMMPGGYPEAICRTGGAWAFFANPGKTDQSEGICEGLGVYQKLCLEKRILVK